MKLQKWQDLKETSLEDVAKSKGSIKFSGFPIKHSFSPNNTLFTSPTLTVIISKDKENQEGASTIPCHAEKSRGSDAYVLQLCSDYIELAEEGSQKITVGGRSRGPGIMPPDATHFEIEYIKAGDYETRI